MAAIPSFTRLAEEPCTIAEAAMRIYRWWRASREGQYLGFASRSVLGRVIEEGAGASHTGIRPAPWMSPADEEIDRLVAKMPSELRDALIADQKRSVPTKVICAKLHCTPAEFHRRKEGALGFVAGVLSAGGLGR